MTPAEAIHRFEHLRRFTRDGERAVHKPLLALLMLGRIANGQRDPVTFAEIEPKLKELLGDFGCPSAVNTPHKPFWYQQSDDIYSISATKKIDEFRSLDVQLSFRTELMPLLHQDPKPIDQYH